ncbi:sodium-dependent transporter bedraggled [Cotesia glomerata]|uniref:sodium-dependent transporter bedraggled n=1 Tax=Cotesia glomerata TaxID=32391 RepID=UPI001D02F1A3|nr:sodium-dependent transporter bedraggled [Cotesia glomerata]
MASSDRKEEEDLIDLDGRACVSVVPVPETVTSEEHLLDVCPPQLEQKLSLTREHKLIRQHCDNGDVLVTLGHDQVVPVRKRIDVVSSETIKRIRVITKNLEPVIKASQQQIRRSSESENNNEFNGPRTHLGDDESTSGLDVNNVGIKAPDGNELSRGNGEKIEDKKLWARNSDGLLNEFNSEPSTSNHQILPTHSKSSSIGHSSEVLASGSSSECSEVDWSWVEELERQRSLSMQSRRPKSLISMYTPTSVAPIDSSGTTSLPTPLTALESPSSPAVAAGVTVTYTQERTQSQKRMRSSTGPVASSDGHSNSSITMPVDSTPAKSITSTLVTADTLPEDFSISRDLNFLDNGTSTSTAVSTSTSTTSNSTPLSFELDQIDHEDAGIPINNSPASSSSWMRASMRRLRHLRLPQGSTRQRTHRPLTVDAIESSSFTTTSTSSSASSSSASSSRPISAPNSLPDIALIAPEILAAHTNSNPGNSNSNLRPSSAPVAVGRTNNSLTPRTRGRRTANRSRGNNSVADRSCRRNSNRNNSVNNCANGDNSDNVNNITRINSPQRTSSTPSRRCDRQRDGSRRNGSGGNEDEESEENPLGKWPHALSPALACLGCTLGLFNISRFSILSVQFGANFIVQFLVLSLVLGIPLLTLQVCLGQRLAAGAVDMWKISPVFHGVGIALLVAHALIGIYSIIGVSWMFVYFRDSFITKQDRYRWAEPFFLYREDTKPMNLSVSYKLHETVPDYFSGVVLQRHHLNEPSPGIVTLKFQVAFNLAVVWMIVFVSLSKGLRSYGKVVYVFTLVPVFGTLILCTKLLGLTPPGTINQLFPATVWSEFFINSKSWIAASSEVFLTWGVLGAAAMQIAAHNKYKNLLQRDTSLVIVLTIVVLLLSAFLANTCVQILRYHGYTYTTSSFEKISSYVFMRPINQAPPPGYGNTPERFMSHASFLLGQRTIKPGADLTAESGYQSLRLSTELVPATLALLGAEQVSPFWAVLFYFILILFGIAQQLAIWHCVITGIMAINAKMMKLWETTITFFSCACAYILGLPMATEWGIYVVYYLDYTIGGGWWIIILYLVQVGAVFGVRGRPHTGEAVVAELFSPTGRCLKHWAGPLLYFTWNVILPIMLMVLSITLFRSSNFRELYSYRRNGKDYWAVWSRQLGAAMQLIPILIIPAVAIIQTCRYLNNGPPDIFDTEQTETNDHCEHCNGNRIQLLYRPSLEPESARRRLTQLRNNTTTSIHHDTTGILPTTSDVPFEDPPPKYTPPPSYTTATGARIAKMLRQSFRQSVRRIASVLGESSVARARPALQPPPPDYATVLVEMNHTIVPRDVPVIHTIESRPDVADVGPVSHRHSHSHSHSHSGPIMDIRIGSQTLDRVSRNTFDRCPVERTHSTIDRNRRRLHNTGSSNLTAADVANLLRSSIRRGTNKTHQTLQRSSLLNHQPAPPINAASIENLVTAAAPIGQDSLVFNKPLVSEHRVDSNDDNGNNVDNDINIDNDSNEDDNYQDNEEINDVDVNIDVDDVEKDKTVQME